ncbi:MAG: L,D-transpeptidase [Bdellovibrionales bacterium]|nr:L,D-transpeptidase [Bdellovibrionales bacterium]
MKRIWAVGLSLVVLLVGGDVFAAPVLKQMQNNQPPGKIIISYSQRRLYYVLDSTQVLEYKVAVPQRRMMWLGQSRVDGKHIRPAWAPPTIVKKENPRIPDLIPGGDPRNPMGERAITLENNSVTDQIAIHGVAASMEKSIGTAASYGCIRMRNEDVIDLYDRVRIGTLVEMIP